MLILIIAFILAGAAFYGFADRKKKDLLAVFGILCVSCASALVVALIDGAQSAAVGEKIVKINGAVISDTFTFVSENFALWLIFTAVLNFPALALRMLFYKHQKTERKTNYSFLAVLFGIIAVIGAAMSVYSLTLISDGIFFAEKFISRNITLLLIGIILLISGIALTAMSIVKKKKQDE